MRTKARTAASQVQLEGRIHLDRDRQELKAALTDARTFLQAEPFSFQDLLTAASPTLKLPGCSFSQDTLLGCPGIDSGSPLDEALLLEFERDLHDWINAAGQTNVTEPMVANLPMAPSSISPEWLLGSASSTPGRLAAAHLRHGPLSTGITQSVQQSGCYGLSAPGPQMRPSLGPSASSQPDHARRSYMAHLADPGPISPMPKFKAFHPCHCRRATLQCIWAA